MNNIWQLTKFVLQTFALMVTDLQYILILGVVFFLVYRQYVKVQQYEERMFKLKRINPFMETVTALVYGIFGGMVATIMFLALGISVSDAGIAYLWLVAMLLMLINPRFVCFAYAGGLVSLVALITGYPQLNIATLMALVAILHMVESLLIFVDGYHNPTPMYYKHSDGRVVGGFTLQKFWPMPTIALVGITVISSSVDLLSVSMPDWWPVFQSGVAVPADHSLIHVLFPLIVALGYSDFVRSELPKTKARRSALWLFIYSLVLLALAILANHYPVFLILPILFAPFGHEFLIIWARKREEGKKPVFHSEDGVMVLTVYPNSPAQAMGLKTGDVIKTINGEAVPNLPTLVEHISPWLIDPVLVVENQFQTPSTRVIEYVGKVPPLGIVPAPQGNQGYYMQFREGWIKRKIEQLRSKGK